MKIRPNHSNQSGDTIVEVLIAVAVISSVLVGAFYISQKSTIAVRTSQEQSEMLQVLQGQVELVRAVAMTSSDNTTGVFASPQYFCMDGSLPATPKLIPFPSNKSTNYPAKCTIDSLYNVAVSYDSTTEVFNFVGQWPLLDGNTGHEAISYRVYPGQ